MTVIDKIMDTVTVRLTTNELDCIQYVLEQYFANEEARSEELKDFIESISDDETKEFVALQGRIASRLFRDVQIAGFVIQGKSEKEARAMMERAEASIKAKIAEKEKK